MMKREREREKDVTEWKQWRMFAVNGIRFYNIFAPRNMESGFFFLSHNFRENVKYHESVISFHTRCNVWEHGDD